MIYLENLSNDEKKVIEELRKRMENDLPKHMYEDTGLLYRFLKARDFDVDNAENMLKRHIAWRKHFQVDTILQDFSPRPFFKKFLTPSHLGLDKNGDMIKYSPLGNLEGRELLKCAQMNEYMKNWVWYLEELNEHVKKLNAKSRKTLQLTVIINLDKLTLANVTHKKTIEAWVRFLRLVQDNYPEILNAAYIINAPGYYVFLYSILKNVMASALIQKVQIYSYSGWKEKLLEIMDEDVLPAFLGGNRTDPDGNPLCTTFRLSSANGLKCFVHPDVPDADWARMMTAMLINKVSHGGRIPDKYFLSEEEKNFTDRSLVKRITILSKQKKEIPVHVTETGSQIHWEFLIGSKDISFGIFLKMSESEIMEILPMERYDTIDGVEKGSYKAQRNGNYIIVFDNSYSWMNSKEVDYCIIVLKPAL